MADLVPTTLMKKPLASTSPLALWVRAMGYDPKEEIESMTVDMNSMTGGSQCSSGITQEIASPSDVAKELYDGNRLSFDGKTSDANINILSLESSSSEGDVGVLGVDVGQSFEDQAFARNSTPLYEALRRREWRQAMVFLQNGSYVSRSLVDGSVLSEPRIVQPEEQVRTWVSMYEADGRMVWRRLPIHDALCRGAPAELISAMLQLYPLGAEARDWDGNLPLHLAMEHNVDSVIVEMILQEHPSAMEVRNDKGKLPLECVTIQGKEAALRGEVLQSYVSSAKQVATQQVPKLKEKLFDVNKTIEAAKSELRLAKVELGMIKQQEKMRIQSKEKEESRMKEEVLRLRTELDFLRCEREEMASEKKQWEEKAKKQHQQHQDHVLVVSDSDSDDSQRSWIAMEFTEMVSELEQSTQKAKQRQTRRCAREETRRPTVPRPFYQAGEASKFRGKLDPYKTGDEYDLKEVQTVATESSLDGLSEDESATIISARDSGESEFKTSSRSTTDHSSIKSIREQLEQTRRELDSRSNSEDGAEQPNQRSHGLGSRSRSGSGSENRGEELADRIKRLESCSNSEDNSEGIGHTLAEGSSNGMDPPGEQGTNGSDTEHDFEPNRRLSLLDDKLSSVLERNLNDRKDWSDNREPEGPPQVSIEGSASRSRSGNGWRRDFDEGQREAISQVSSKSSVASSRSGRRSVDAIAESSGRPEVVTVVSSSSMASSTSGRRSARYDNENSGQPESASKVSSKLSTASLRSALEYSGELESVSKASSNLSTASSRSALDWKFLDDSQAEEVSEVSSKASGASSRSGQRSTNSDHTSPLEGVVKVSSKISAASSRSGGGSSSSHLERGLAMISQKTSTETRWMCNSMADDLTCQDEDDEDEESSCQVVKGELDSDEEWKPEQHTIAEADLFEENSSNKVVIVAEGRDEWTKETSAAKENRDEAPTVRRTHAHVTFAEETVVYEDEQRDSFSPQFRQFDDQVDKAMTRISRKSHKLLSSTSRSRSTGRRRSRHRCQALQSSEQPIYVTTDDKVEILGAIPEYSLDTDTGSVKSSNSGAMSEPRSGGGGGSSSDWETGYVSEI